MTDTTLWQEAYRCTGCGYLSDGSMPVSFCPACGSLVSHERVAIKTEPRYFGKDRVTVKLLKQPVRFRATPEFCHKLAEIMDVEIDGGDSAAAYVKDCIEEAYQSMGSQ